MIEIKPVTTDTPGLYRMTVFVENKVWGSVDLLLQGEVGVLSNLFVTQRTEASISFGLGKAVLNLADFHNVKTVICTDKNMEWFLMPLGFLKTEDAVFKVSLQHYFDTGCH